MNASGYKRLGVIAGLLLAGLSFGAATDTAQAQFYRGRGYHGHVYRPQYRHYSYPRYHHHYYRPHYRSFSFGFSYARPRYYAAPYPYYTYPYPYYSYPSYGSYSYPSYPSYSVEYDYDWDDDD